MVAHWPPVAAARLAPFGLGLVVLLVAYSDFQEVTYVDLAAAEKDCGCAARLDPGMAPPECSFAP
jgi:hypothetical protein